MSDSKNNDLQNYYKMIKFSGLLLIIALLLTLIITKNTLDCLSVVYGYILGVSGFLVIIYTVYHFELDYRFKKKVIVSYVLRFISYFVLIALGAVMGLNIILMVIGLLLMNFAIKISVALEERGHFN